MAEPGNCKRCPRLVALRREIRSTHPSYHAAPVVAWGRENSRMLIVGLAPGMHGANRTGRPFTGDASGDFLFAALHRTGFASAPKADEAKLHDVRITNAVKCLPPGNRPLAEEIGNCSAFLEAEIDSLYRRRPRHVRVLLCLGGLAHDAVVKALSSRTPETLPRFRHGQVTEMLPGLVLIDTYHPSRLNTNTGRLTEAMFDQVLCEARRLLAR